MAVAVLLGLSIVTFLRLTFFGEFSDAGGLADSRIEPPPDWPALVEMAEASASDVITLRAADIPLPLRIMQVGTQQLHRLRDLAPEDLTRQFAIASAVSPDAAQHYLQMVQEYGHSLQERLGEFRVAVCAENSAQAVLPARLADMMFEFERQSDRIVDARIKDLMTQLAPADTELLVNFTEDKSRGMTVMQTNLRMAARNGALDAENYIRESCRIAQQ